MIWVYDVHIHRINVLNTDLDKHYFERKLVNIFLPIGLTYVLGAQKNRLNERVILSIHNICFV